MSFVQNFATNTGTVAAPGQDTYLEYLSVQYTSNATAGNRQVVVQILDAQANVWFQMSAGAVQAASLVRRYNFLSGAARETAAVNGELNVPVPENWFVPAGGSIKVFDSAGIAAGDSMIVSGAVSTVR